MKKKQIILAVLVVGVFIILFLLIGCGMVQDKTGRLMHKADVPLGVEVTPVLPEDVVDKVIKDVAPFAGLLPYGYSLLAAAGAGAGLYRKYKPMIGSFKSMVRAIELLPKEIKDAYKTEVIMGTRERLAVTKEKLYHIDVG